jgi:hypothetical protein
MRNGLLDSRTLNQVAPFDHSSLMVSNDHPVDNNGYPLLDPTVPDKHRTYYDYSFEREKGALPLPSFL